MSNHIYTLEEQEKFIERSERNLKELRSKVHSLFAFKIIGEKERNELLNKLDGIKRHLPWCEGAVGSNEMISVAKKLIGNIFVELHKYEKDSLVGKKNKKKHQRREKDIAEDSRMWFGAGVDTHHATKEMVSVDFRQFKSDYESINVASGPAKLDRFINSPVIYILPEVYHKIMTWTSLLDDEITGLGTVEEIGPSQFLIDSMYLFDQKVSKARCEATGAMALVDLCERMEKDGKNPANMKVWWHSHNSMGVSPSSQDDETGRNFCSNGFLISLITNHKGEMYSKMNIFKPIDMIIDNVPVYRTDPKLTDEFINTCKDEIKKYVKTEKTSYYGGSPSIYSGYGAPSNTNPTPLELARMELEKGRAADIDVSPSPAARTYDDPNHPVNIWGDDFTENNIKYKWNYHLDRYEYFCMLTGKQIMEHEINLFGGHDYNEFDTRPNDTPKELLF